MIEKNDQNPAGSTPSHPSAHVGASAAPAGSGPASRPTLAPAPRELTDDEARAMWAKYPGLTFQDFNLDRDD